MLNKTKGRGTLTFQQWLIIILLLAPVALALFVRDNL